MTRKRPWIVTWLGPWVVLSIGCADAPPVEETSAPLVESGALPADVVHLLHSGDDLDPADLDRIYTVDHFVRVGSGRRVHVVERATLRAWLSWPHRGALLLPGTVVESSFWDIDLDGYRFQSELASRGFFTFAVDYEGTGQSTYPADGLSVTHDFLVDESRTVLRAMRILRLVPRMDVIGESNGGAIAAELCADQARTRSCVLSSMLYREGTPFFQAVFLDPGFIAFLEGQPGGYLDVTPPLYFNIVSRTSPDVANVILSTQPGVYAVGPLLAPTTLPWFDPTGARVPALVIQGTEDNIATQADAEDLVASYGSAHHHGGEATLLRIDGAGHIPRIEPSPIHEQWNDAVLDFLDP
jgi:alpha-beta hydrolase superfamily lysophospholipase